MDTHTEEQIGASYLFTVLVTGKLERSALGEFRIVHTGIVRFG